MTTPLIGVAPRLLSTDSDSDGLSDAGARLAGLDAIVRAGGRPVVLYVDDPADACNVIGGMAGLFFPGGGDSDPTYYGDDWKHPKLRLVPPQQDASDMALLRAALDAKVPTLAVCRGMQTLNIVCGGSLVQHLDPGEINHEHTTHDITITEPDSLVRTMMGAETFPGCSRHQQAVLHLGAGLRITARSPDGCVEAIEHTTSPAVGLQWHPELAGAAGAPQDEPFRWLVEQADQYVRAGAGLLRGRAAQESRGPATG